MTNSDSRTITLSDGRALGYRELGESDGTPIIFCHGTPGARFCLSERDAIVNIPGTRWIVPERPGYGLSDPLPDRQLLDWPRDVAALADALGLTSFVIAGGSGGGPHALACAYALADRISCCLVFASPAPLEFPRATRGLAFGNRAGIWLVRTSPSLYRRAIDSMRNGVLADPGRFITMMQRQMPTPDAELLADEGYARDVLRDVVEAYRQDSEGHAVDGRLALASRDWGFALADIEVPVYGWYGDQDRLVTLRMMRHLAEQIPAATMKVIDGAGHLLSDHPDVVDEVETVLLGHAPRHHGSHDLSPESTGRAAMPT